MAVATRSPTRCGRDSSTVVISRRKNRMTEATSARVAGRRISGKCLPRTWNRGIEIVT
jgi:hypothetical protein